MGHGVVKVEQEVVVEGDAAGDMGGGWQQAEESERGGGFAGAGFAYEAEGLAGGDGEGDSLDHLVQAEGDGQVLDFE
jgi:hypothetical protein